MKKLITMALMAACAAPGLALASTVDLDAFGSYGDAKFDNGYSPSGGGGGIRARVNVPFTTAFFTGEYQSNKMDDSSFTPSHVTLDDTRVGVGSEISAGPLSVFGRAEYVHMAFKPDTFPTDNSDGYGLHVGVDAGVGIAGVYGSAGYVHTSDTKGPELLVGGRVTLLPLVQLFAEYRYTELNDNNGSNNDGHLNDYRAGVRVSF
ncbi:MAG TPA: hypothetical protein VHE37_06690 [Nevskiaceae bacterium]|nr:hypothetical protein [Nevskiaceae bacterium]